jgi:hypothetical protein
MQPAEKNARLLRGSATIRLRDTSCSTKIALLANDITYSCSTEEAAHDQATVADYFGPLEHDWADARWAIVSRLLLGMLRSEPDLFKMRLVARIIMVAGIGLTTKLGKTLARYG